MNKYLTILCLNSLLVLLPVAVHAEVGGNESCDAVTRMFDTGSTASEVIRSVMDSGMALAEATVYTMVCGGEQYRVEVATSGVSMAGNLAQARSVVAALLATAGETGPVADAARSALRSYERLADQPPIYQGDYSPTGGGGVSPST